MQIYRERKCNKIKPHFCYLNSNPFKRETKNDNDRKNVMKECRFSTLVNIWADKLHGNNIKFMSLTFTPYFRTFVITNDTLLSVFAVIPLSVIMIIAVCVCVCLFVGELKCFDIYEWYQYLISFVEGKV